MSDQHVTYFEGGHDPDAPGHNVAEVVDTGAGTLTRYDTAGEQTEHRPLTAEERAEWDELAPPAPAAGPSRENLLEQAAAARTVAELRAVLVETIEALQS